MPNATVRANAPAMPIDRRLFLAATTAAATFGVLHATMARSIPAAAPVAFDPAELVDVWERLGNVVYWTTSRSGKKYIAFYTANGEFPEFADLNRLGDKKYACPDWVERTVAHLKSIGRVEDQYRAWEA